MGIDIENEINKIRWERWRAKQDKEREKTYFHCWGGDVAPPPTVWKDYYWNCVYEAGNEATLMACKYNFPGGDVPSIKSGDFIIHERSENEATLNKVENAYLETSETIVVEFCTTESAIYGVELTEEIIEVLEQTGTNTWEGEYQMINITIQFDEDQVVSWEGYFLVTTVFSTGDIKSGTSVGIGWRNVFKFPMPVEILKAFEDIPYIIDHAPPEFHYEINLGAFKQIVHVVVER